MNLNLLLELAKNKFWKTISECVFCNDCIGRTLFVSSFVSIRFQAHLFQNNVAVLTIMLLYVSDIHGTYFLECFSNRLHPSVEEEATINHMYILLPLPSPLTDGKIWYKSDFVPFRIPLSSNNARGYGANSYAKYFRNSGSLRGKTNIHWNNASGSITLCRFAGPIEATEWVNVAKDLATLFFFSFKSVYFWPITAMFEEEEEDEGDHYILGLP